jgi:hypothetical protein
MFVLSRFPSTCSIQFSLIVLLQESLRYSTAINSVSVNWGGFVDVHSAISFYRFCVATKPHLCDVTAWEEVGLLTGNSIL